MCLSDWSSDVCSSDLVSELLPGTASAVPEDTVAVLDRLAVWAASTVTTIEIGRASCREREERAEVAGVVAVKVERVPVAEKSAGTKGGGSRTESDVAT